MPLRSAQPEVLPGHYEAERGRTAPLSKEEPRQKETPSPVGTHRRQLGRIRSLLAALRPDRSSFPSEAQPLSSAPFLIEKLQQQQETYHSTNVAVFDIDGTVYSQLSLSSFLHARKINKQTAKMLREHNIPIITNSGGPLGRFKLLALGLGQPDVVIARFGAQIQYKTVNPFSYSTERTGKVVQKRVRDVPIAALEQQATPPGYKTVWNESLRGTNTSDTYSGTIALVPKSLGKGKALMELLETTAHALGGNRPIVAHVFGDGLGDLEMITHPSTKQVIIFGHAVGAKPRLRTALLTHGTQEAQPGLYHTHFQTGPVLHLGPAQEAIREVIADITDHIPNPRNSRIRKMATGIASFINRLNLFTRHTAPNTITMNGFKKVTSATEQLHRLGADGKPHPIQGLRERTRLALGYLDDFIDGLQAKRMAGKRQPEEAALGPYLDPLTDRAREIHALGLRAMTRLEENPTDALTTCKAMVACVMPSLARAFVEAATGNAVPESTEGSMLARTQLLRASAKAHMEGRPGQSLELDHTIVINGMKTFTQRQEQAVDSFGEQITLQTFVTNGVIQDATKPKQTQFRNTAFARMRVNISILQQLDGAIRRALEHYPTQLAEYKVFMDKSGTQKYVNLDLTRFPRLDERLQLNKFLQLEGNNLFAVQPTLPKVT